MLETLLNFSYVAGYIVAWSGLLRQTIFIYRTKSAKNFTMFYVSCLLLAKALAVPRTVLSDYWVWWLQEGISTLLTVVFCIGIIKYRKN